MVAPLLESLLDHPRVGPLIAHRRRVEGRAASWGEPQRPLPRDLVEALEACGIERLYAHQAQGLDLVRAGHDVLVATPTASGKTLLFALAVLESIVERPRGRALLLYPTKALAQDQLAGFRALAAGLGGIRPPRFEIYDGDTPPDLRRRIRSDPPEVLITNPDMLHLGILAHHAEWDGFLRDLRFVVLDELHVYRGLFGAHVHHILRRLERACDRRGGKPRLIAASATIGNPEEFARRLLARDVRVVSESGAPASPKDMLFVNPIGVSPYTAAVRVLIECIRAGRQTIAFTKARRVTELLYQWLVQAEPGIADRVAPYRAGYLPEERRRIEARLFRGELAAVVSTSALELGIDVGSLDACVLVGYPGSLVSSWQRIGRVGRQRQAGLVVLVALPDALDQYVVRHPDRFFDGAFERATLDPWNPLVAGKHLPCAAAESPIERAEVSAAGPVAARVVDDLVRDGRLVEDADGTKLYALRRRQHREVRVRSAGEPFAILDAQSRRSLGAIDGTRLYHECHPGAVYLHGGRSYVIEELDIERRQVVARRASVDYYTVVLGDKESEILERHDARRVGPFPVALGRLRVTVRVREYQKRRLFDGEPITSHALDVPPRVFETIGLWIELPPDLPAAFTERRLHFMGGIHAVEHATIGLFPLLAIADRDDLGGISYTGHPQTGTPAIFVYDGVPGGAGLAEQAFAGLERLLGETADLVERCPCEDGCPGCIQSPKCGNGNRPLDKAAARVVLQLATGRSALDALGVGTFDRPLDAPIPRYRAPQPRQPRDGESEARRHGVRRAGNLEPEEARRTALGRTVILDLETQRGADEVGGWGQVERMGLAIAVVYDETGEQYRAYRESEVDRLLVDLALADRVVGFNIDRFDMRVLAPYCTFDLSRICTLDLLWDIHHRIGFRLSLDHLARMNLGESKTASGLESLVWWREGRTDLVEEYCRKDVELTRRLWQLGRSQGFLLYRDHAERTVRVPVSW